MAKAKLSTDGTLLFWCPGCDEAHGTPVENRPEFAPRPVWGFNADFDRPTLTPSVLVQGNLYGPDKQGFRKYDGPYPCELHPSRCHSFVRDGRIEFLSDCTHALAGQTVDLPNWED